MAINKNAIRNLMSQSNLRLIISEAVKNTSSKDGNLQFSSFQRKTIQDTFPGFLYQFCITSSVVIGRNDLPIEIESCCFNLPDEILESYLRYSHLDELSPLIYKNPGRALSYSHVCLKENIQHHPFFINHCKKYGIHQATSVGYRYPGHQKTFLTFDYLGDGNNFWINFDERKLELASLPFTLAWLFRFGKIDLQQLEYYFLLLEGLTESELLNLRKYINDTLKNYEMLAADLGIKASTLRDSLRSIRTDMCSKIGIDTSGKGSTPVRVLDGHYAFLRMLGDHTAEIIR